jgi:hypothetical protein
MKHYIKSLQRKVCFYTTAILGITQALSAFTFPAPETYEVRGELLYLKPTVDQSYYAVKSINNIVGENNFPFGKRYNNRSEFKPGFRIEGAYGLCGGVHALDGRFAYFTSKHSNSVSGNFLFDTTGFPGFGAQAPEDTTYAGRSTSKQNFKYYAGDLTFNRTMLECCPENLYVMMGLHVAYAQLNDHFTSTGNSIDDGKNVPVANKLIRKSHFWGIGPQIGLDYKYLVTDFCSCDRGTLSFEGSARASLLCSTNHSDLHYSTQRTGTRGVKLDNKSLFRVTPSVDAKLGLIYNYVYCSYELNLEFGYEMIWYSDAVNTVYGTDVAFAGDSIDIFSSMNLQGPYVSLGVSF